MKMHVRSFHSPPPRTLYNCNDTVHCTNVLRTVMYEHMSKDRQIQKLSRTCITISSHFVYYVFKNSPPKNWKPSIHSRKFN